MTIGPSLDAIEHAYDVLLALPDADSISFFSLQDHEQAARAGFERSCAYLFSDALNWLKFFWWSTAFKTRQITAALIREYNCDNYLAWMILGRSTLEQAAVAFHFVKKIKQLQLSGPHFAASEVKAFEDLMLEYAHGTRFNWTDLLNGSLKASGKKDFSSPSAPKAVNVLTALSHLAKRDQRYRDVEIAYAMLSDFAHPNMASHATVVEMPSRQAGGGQVEIAADPGPLRGEFIAVVSTPWVSTGVGTNVELLMELAPLLRAWADYIDSRAAVTFDFTK